MTRDKRRKRIGGVLCKFVGGEWVPVSPREFHKDQMSQLERLMGSKR